MTAIKLSYTGIDNIMVECDLFKRCKYATSHNRHHLRLRQHSALKNQWYAENWSLDGMPSDYGIAGPRINEGEYRTNWHALPTASLDLWLAWLGVACASEENWKAACLQEVERWEWLDDAEREERSRSEARVR